jgi:hypothetical protein
MAVTGMAPCRPYCFTTVRKLPPYRTRAFDDEFGCAHCNVRVMLPPVTVNTPRHWRRKWFPETVIGRNELSGVPINVAESVLDASSVPEVIVW